MKCVSLALLFLQGVDATQCVEDICCVDDTTKITGKCSGNTAAADDFTCSGGWKLKLNSATIDKPSGDGGEETCCVKKTCDDVTCPNLKGIKTTSSYTWAAGTAPTEADCCEWTGCTQLNDQTIFTCPAGKKIRENLDGIATKALEKIPRCYCEAKHKTKIFTTWDKVCPDTCPAQTSKQKENDSKTSTSLGKRSTGQLAAVISWMSLGSFCVNSMVA